MVILIGGVSCTGKTNIAQRLLETHKMPYLSIDHLKMGLFRGMDNCPFTPEDSNEVIGEYLWPILKAIIMTNIENSQNIIIEGCYLLPNRITEFDDDYIKHIISLYIGFSRGYIEKNYLSGIVGHRSEIESKGYDAVFPMKQLISDHEEQKELCAMNKANYFEISEDYSKEIKNVCEWIDKEICRRTK